MTIDTGIVELVIDVMVVGRSVDLTVSEDAPRHAQRGRILHEGVHERGPRGCRVRYRVMTDGLDNDELIYIARLYLSEEDYLALIRAIDAEYFESLVARRPARIHYLLCVRAPTPEHQTEEGMGLAGVIALVVITELLGCSPADMHHQGLSH